MYTPVVHPEGIHCGWAKHIAQIHTPGRPEKVDIIYVYSLKRLICVYSLQKKASKLFEKKLCFFKYLIHILHLLVQFTSLNVYAHKIPKILLGLGVLLKSNT